MQSLPEHKVRDDVLAPRIGSTAAQVLGRQFLGPRLCTRMPFRTINRLNWSRLYGSSERDAHTAKDRRKNRVVADLLLLRLETLDLVILQALEHCRSTQTLPVLIG